MLRSLHRTSEPGEETPSLAAIPSISRLRCDCARSDCPYRGKPWSRWLNRTASVEFGGQIYCCAGCAETAFESEARRHLQSPWHEEVRPHRIPLGLLLVSRGFITHAQLQKALRLQQSQPGRRLGQILFETGVLGEETLLSVLSAQWGCPLFPLRDSCSYLHCAGLLPFALLQSAAILPVHHSMTNGILHLAFTERIDHTLLYAIEGMLGHRVSPCVAAERSVAEALLCLRTACLPQETVFDSVREPAEIARMAADYAHILQATCVRAVRASEYLWFRLENHRGTHHLLFQWRSRNALAKSWSL